MESNSFNPEEIIEKYGNMVYKIAISQLKNTYDADDVFQDVFVRMINNHMETKSEEHQKAWLIRVTINLCKDHFRKQSRHNEVELEDYIPAEENNQELCLADYVGKLPEKYRTVLHLFYYEYIPIEEMTTILDMKSSTVRSLLHRGRKMLKDILDKEAPRNEWTI